jgi:hypothetical protein
MLQFLAWVARGRRTHGDVMDAWQSSCPRLSLWEDAVIGGYVRFAGDAARSVVLTRLGEITLAAQSQTEAKLAAD